MIAQHLEIERIIPDCQIDKLREFYVTGTFRGRRRLERGSKEKRKRKKKKMKGRTKRREDARPNKVDRR